MTRATDQSPRAGKRPIRILLVDDQRLFRQSLRHLLEEDSEIEVVGDAADGQEAVILATELIPDDPRTAATDQDPDALGA
jgi:CheY-like chemotaxis protein